MAISVDDATVARVEDSPAEGAAITTASFTPANNSLLICCVGGDLNSPTASVILTYSGGSLSWTEAIHRDGAEVGAQGGYASIGYALVGTGASMTVSVTIDRSDDNVKPVSIKVYIVTGHNTSSPIGATGEGSSTTNNITPTVYTSTVNNSRAFGSFNDYNNLGLPTSTDVGDGYNMLTDDGISVYKAADTATAGTGVTLNANGNGTGAAGWNWVAVEVKPAGSVSVKQLAALGVG